MTSGIPERINMQKTRKCGILLPLASLPSEEGIGTFGKNAYKFIDYLASAGVKIWQILPLLPLSYGNSPYSPCASEAFCHYYIDLQTLGEQGLLTAEEISSANFGSDPRRIDYGALFSEKTKILKKAYRRFDKNSDEWRAFVAGGKYADYAVFMTLKERFSYRDSAEWGEYKTFDNRLIAAFIGSNRDNYEFFLFTQYLCEKQWRALKAYANENGVEILGDIPIYLARDSVEVWKYGKELFSLDDDGTPSEVAGVPPDAFSEDGQLWGNPVYDWEKMKKNGYKWWKNRLNYCLSVYDIVRLDHFRGFDRYYCVKSGEKSAKNGEWKDGPKFGLFKDFAEAKIVAEDLGVIDDGVRTLMRETGYPGMKVMSFGLSGDPYSEHKPSNYPENCVGYTGTHDNEPLKVLFSDENPQKEIIEKDLKSECEKEGVKGSLKTVDAKISAAIRLLLASKAFIAVIPFHDLKRFGEEARINVPSVFSDKNWSFRYVPGDFDEQTKRRLKKWIKAYAR